MIHLNFQNLDLKSLKGQLISKTILLLNWFLINFLNLLKLIDSQNNHHIIYDMKKLLFLISEKLPELCNHHSNFLITKYISYTSILLAPFCSSIYNYYSTNTTLYAYSTDINFKKSNENYFKR